MPVFKFCTAKLAADAIDVCDELSLLSALAEYLLIGPGINVADKASAVNVSVAIDFFMVGILILSRKFDRFAIVREDCMKRFTLDCGTRGNFVKYSCLRAKSAHLVGHLPAGSNFRLRFANSISNGAENNAPRIILYIHSQVSQPVSVVSRPHRLRRMERAYRRQ